MNLLIEAGGTKTDWVLFCGDEQHEITTSGFNPSYDDHIDFPQDSFFSHHKVDRVFFYGAGVITPEQKEAVAEQLHEKFGSKDYLIENDVQGACRSVLGSKPGWVGLLGTGSGMVHFDGAKAVSTVASLGYLLGDEGSGMAIGRTILRDFLRGKIPEQIAQSIQLKYPQEELLSLVYSESRPPGLFASFVEFIEDMSDPYVQRMVQHAFTRYFETYLPPRVVGIASLSFVGSIAWKFRRELEQVASTFDIEIHQVERSPKVGLLRYHGGECG